MQSEKCKKVLPIYIIIIIYIGKQIGVKNFIVTTVTTLAKGDGEVQDTQNDAQKG
jgi:hypothetical protein